MVGECVRFLDDIENSDDTSNSKYENKIPRILDIIKENDEETKEIPDEQ